MKSSWLSMAGGLPDTGRRHLTVLTAGAGSESIEIGIDKNST